MKFLALILVCAVSAPHAALAQSGGIQIQVVEGDGAVNDIRTREVVEPVVQVLDAEGQPVAGASVTFQSPVSGPSVTFYGAQRSLTVRTDEEGLARVASAMPNTDAGPFQIAVEATDGVRIATAALEQRNVLFDEGPVKKRRWGWKMWTLVGVAVAIVVTSILVDSSVGPSTNGA